MKKTHQVFVICLVLGLFVALAIGVYLSEGVGMRNTHFIRLETEAKVEFLTNSDNVVLYAYPVNGDGKICLIGESFIGLRIEDAVIKYLDLCCRLGYIDVEAKDNGVQISVSSSFTQSLENRVYRTCNKFFLDNAIYCVIAESDADLALYNEKKEKNVYSIEKLVLIKSMQEKTDHYSFETLNSMNESTLINLLQDYNKAYNNIDKSEDEKVNKKLDKLSNCERKYENHIQKLDDNILREFSEKYAKYKKTVTYFYELDFDKKLSESK